MDFEQVHLGGTTSSLKRPFAPESRFAGCGIWVTSAGRVKCCLNNQCPFGANEGC